MKENVKLSDYQFRNEFCNKCGVYLIYSDISKSMYVGSSIHLSVRFSHHLTRIRDRKQTSNLYKAIRNTGLEHWFVSILEYTSPEKRINRENYWIKKMEATGADLLNSKPAMPVYNFTEDAIKKMKANHYSPRAKNNN